MHGKCVLYMVMAIVSELIATTSLKLSDGFTHPGFLVLTIVGYVVSFTLLTLMLKEMSLGLVYGIWGGAGTLLTTIVGIVIWDDPFSLVIGIGMVAVVAGIALMSIGEDKAAAEQAASKAQA